MKTRNTISRRQAIAAAGVGLAAARSAWSQQQAAAKPNIIFIMADDLGYADVSCYGRRDYQTPNIDRIATDGMKFMQAYANSSVCTATRVALITGRYQYRLPIGLEEPLATASQRNVGLPPKHSTIPSLLKQAGYATTLLGKWHLGNLPNYGPLQSGYDHFWGFRSGGIDYFTHKSGPATTDTADLWDQDAKVEQTGYLTDLLGARAVKVVADYAAARQPFFLSMHFNAPHWPWEGPGDEAESRRVAALADYDGGSIKIYAEMMRSLDTQVGNILAGVERAGIADNTIVVFTSDNGGERFSDTWPFSGKKTELLEGGLRIPLLVRWPGHVARGSTSQQVAMSMDWLPTFLAAGGGTQDPAYPSDGISLLPALAGGAPVARKLYWRFRNNAQRALRDGDMKWLKIRDNTFLFNVVDDPMERANLRARQPAVYQRMVAEYEAWNATMLSEDPLAQSAGPVPAQTVDRPGN